MSFQANLDAVEKQTGKTPQQIVDWGSPRVRGRRRPTASARTPRPATSCRG